MLVVCPQCRCRLRYQADKPVAALRIKCPRCGGSFKVRKPSPGLTIIVAHEDETVRQLLQERLARLQVAVKICRKSEEVLAQSQIGRVALLIDVAFEGIFPFQLIDKLSTDGLGGHKIILLSSVYNRTAYKKSPDSLYGADGYLELHHIGDCLLARLAELFPELATQVAQIEQVRTESGERPLLSKAINERAASLAKLLVADIMLYHHDRLHKDAELDELMHHFSEQLAEGKRVLLSRLPQAENVADDLLRQEFSAAYRAYQQDQ